MNIIKSIARPLASGWITLLLLLAFAFVAGWATIIENDHGTPAAKQLIYNSYALFGLLALLSVNFLLNIKLYGLFGLQKLPVLILHIGFVVILVGAGITFFAGSEGLMHIREGQKTNIIQSNEKYLFIQFEGGKQNASIEHKLLYSNLKKPNFEFEQNGIKISAIDYIERAIPQLSPDPNGKSFIEVVTTSNGERQTNFLNMGAANNIGRLTIDVNVPLNKSFSPIKINKANGSFFISSNTNFSLFDMQANQSRTFLANIPDTLYFGKLYNFNGQQIVFLAEHQQKKLTYQSQAKQFRKNNDQHLLQLLLASQENQYSLGIYTTDTTTHESVLGGKKVKMRIGHKFAYTPFFVRLNDFVLETYPGSENPSAYSSDVKVEDKATTFDYKIFMNNVLDYKGYRFFQASYDTDQLGTVLQVSRDYWGTRITYLGYALLFFGMIANLFNPNSRFRNIYRKLAEHRAKVASVALFLLFSPLFIFAEGKANTDTLAPKTVSQELSADFGKLLVQEIDGRIKPLNTLSSEFMRKVYGKSKYKHRGSQFTTDQVFLSMMLFPDVWAQIPIIKIDEKKGGLVYQQLNIDPCKHITYTQLIDSDGNYRLYDVAQKVRAIRPAEQSELEKELLKVDERFNIVFQVFTGGYLRMFPCKTDPTKTWATFKTVDNCFAGEDSLFVAQIIPTLFLSVIDSFPVYTAEAKTYISYIDTYQQTIGQNIIPNTNRVKAELLYNKLAINTHLFGYLWLLAIITIISAVGLLLGGSRIFVWLHKWAYWAMLVMFVALTVSLLLRWYVAQFPPWSNGYEMIVLVAWAVLLTGLWFNKFSEFIIPLTALFAGTLLFVAFLDWLNPQITNLVPVLKSFWLKIHVVVIVCSYAPLALSALLGMLKLILISANYRRFSKTIAELEYINELSMGIGLVMLTIGTFLGGIWANESWGRYWGWDAKETWALVSILAYSVVTHLWLVKGLRTTYLFSLLSLLAFFTIIMTSFGVNYYLSGLHSYATGDPVPIPSFVFWIIGGVAILAVTGYLGVRRMRLQK